jgi:outer membrane protein assembly factor BamB
MVILLIGVVIGALLIFQKPSNVVNTKTKNGSSARAALTNPVNQPYGIAVSDGHVWISNFLSKSVSELNASNGSLVRVISARDDRFSNPDDVVATSKHVWITNFASGNSAKSSVTELNASNGSLVRVIDARSDDIENPQQLVLSGKHLWVVGRYITELNAESGSLVRVIPASSIPDPDNLAVSGNDVWVTEDNVGIAELYELDALTGSVLRIINATADGFNDSGNDGVAVAGGHVWVANDSGLNNSPSSVIELNASNGSLVQIIKTPTDGINEAIGDIVAYGANVWVLNSNSVTELNASNSSLVRVIDVPVGDSTYADDCFAVSGNYVWVGNAPNSVNESSSVTELNASTGGAIRVIQ